MRVVLACMQRGDAWHRTHYEHTAIAANMRWQAFACVVFRHGDRICVNVFFSLHRATTAFFGAFLNKRNFSGPQVGVDSDFWE
ncbi:hypothetical protein ACDH70_16235 [Xanthomonas axonopodis pv. poinsettiicola]|uniref:hypothetical protein n=1 Tax=Xanthomonas TaxID=338 RepID=UPI001E4ABDAF|nr:hypothetical protein [Xanthomonas codiaei]MCC8537640.1 hypothetical protein [Xanthomonas codiaei]